MKLQVVVAMPAGIRDLVGIERLNDLQNAHQDVGIEMAFEHDKFIELISQADAAITMHSFRFPEYFFNNNPKLRWVQSITVGLDAFLTPEMIAAEHLTITTCRGPFGPLVAEHATMLMLALARDLPGYLQGQTNHQWRRNDNESGGIPAISQLFGKTVAILGVGDIGGHLARICKVGFGMKVLGTARKNRDNPHVDRYFDLSELNTNLAESDFVINCLPSVPETIGIIGKQSLAAMKPSALFINIGRGTAVDEDALINALSSGQIAGAAADSFAQEPLQDDSPLWDMPNMIITPHIAPGTDLMGKELVDFWSENIRRFAEDEPLLGVVDPKAGY